MAYIANAVFRIIKLPVNEVTLVGLGGGAINPVSW